MLKLFTTKQQSHSHFSSLSSSLQYSARINPNEENKQWNYNALPLTCIVQQLRRAYSLKKKKKPYYTRGKDEPIEKEK